MAGPNVYKLVTAKFLEALEAGTVPWRTPWTAGGSVPRSLATGKAYRGINPFLLQMEAIANGYSSPWWGTFDQIADRAGLVRAGKRWSAPEGDDRPRGVTKGQRGTLIVFWARTTKEATNPVTGQVEERKVFLLRYFKVFNLDQAAFPDGLPDRYTSPTGRPAGFNPVAEAEQLAAGYFGPDNDGPRLVHVDDDRAFYTPVMDVVNVPPVSCFTTAEGYYSTLFHEAGHSTGHPSRLARPGVMEGHRFGDDGYSQEELVAEFTAGTCAASPASTPRPRSATAPPTSPDGPPSCRPTPSSSSTPPPRPNGRPTGSNASTSQPAATSTRPRTSKTQPPDPTLGKSPVHRHEGVRSGAGRLRARPEHGHGTIPLLPLVEREHHDNLARPARSPRPSPQTPCPTGPMHADRGNLHEAPRPVALPGT